MTRRLAAALLSLGIAAAAVLAVATGDAAEPSKRLLILGFDGADAKVTARLMDEGRLPNLAKLRDSGTFAPLMPTNPAQSPVSWASLTTGLNPGGHGIYDFLRRDLTRGESPRIDFAHAKPKHEGVLPGAWRVLLVTCAGAVGGLVGLFVAFAVVGRFAPAWRRGGRLQAAATLPAALSALTAFAILSWLPKTVPVPHNLRSGEPFWTSLDRAGVRCVALEAPLAWPAEPMQHGACLCGLGVPDLRQTWGSFYLWTDDPRVPATTETGGTCFFVRRDHDEFDVVLPGPPDPFADEDDVRESETAADQEKHHRKLALDWRPPKRRESETKEELLRLRRRLTATFHAKLRRGEDLTLSTEDGAEHVLTEGKWSDLIPVTFRANPLVVLRGRVRFLLEAAGDEGGPRRFQPFRLFAGPVQFDPEHAPQRFGLSSPPDFAARLARSVGTFDTLGWPEMTSALKDQVLVDDASFLAHIALVMESRERRLLDRLKRDDWDCLFAMFSEQDRVQHMMYRHADPESPLHDPELAERFGGAIEQVYVDMDRIVGSAIEAAGPDTDVLVVSDHGFAPFRRGVNLTNFLRANGFQAALPDGPGGSRQVGELFRDTQWFGDVDWSQTTAYSMGLGHVYLNRVGREQGGIVTPEQAPAILERIREKLLALTDTDGQRVVRNVYLGSDLYEGARVSDAPDLVVGFEWGYRISWQACLGALDPDVITDNMQPWTGDHCSVDPELVQGILFSTRRLTVEPGATVLDVKPTLLRHFGLTPEGLDGRPLLDE